MYQVKFYDKTATVDDLERGALLETTQHSGFGAEFTGETLEIALDKVAQFFSVTRAELLPYDDQPGLLQVSVLENADASIAGTADMAEFHAGKRKLWIADYSAQVMKCEPVDLTKVLKA